MVNDVFRLALELKKSPGLSPSKRSGEVLDLGRGIKARYAVSDSPIQSDMNVFLQSFLRPPPQANRKMRLKGVIALESSFSSFT